MPSSLSQINVPLPVEANVTSWVRLSLQSKTGLTCFLPLMSSCRKKHRLSRLESFTKRVSKKKLFTLAAYSQEAALLNSRWLLDLWSHPWPRHHPLPLPSNLLISMLKHTMWHAASLPSCWWCFLPPPPPAYSFFSYPTTTFRHAELVYVSTVVHECVAQLTFRPKLNHSLLSDTPTTFTKYS